MNALSDYDLRQVMLIEKKINLFKNKKMGLFELVCDLGGLLNALESIDASWKDLFRAEINTLEMVHDSTEDGSILKWKEDPNETIKKSVSELKKLTTSLLENHLRYSDPSVLESIIIEDSNWLICPKCNDAWESDSESIMTICPKCSHVFHDPRKQTT